MLWVLILTLNFKCLINDSMVHIVNKKAIFLHPLLDYKITFKVSINYSYFTTIFIA
jgi:hypothetical protein